MADITHNDPLVTESKLTEFYNDIKPFLGCPSYVTQEGDEMYFSTEEKVIGRWTDGKPLYQKVYSGTTASSGVTSFSIADLSIDKVIDVSGYIEYATNNFLFLSTFTNANDKGIGYASRINAFIDTSYTSKPYVMILRYTKTTDSAVTTIEQKPTHYSTDEQVVGTWIDGKPIYQKTIDCGTLANGENRIAHNISNLGNLIDGSGSILSTNGGVPIPYSSASTQYNLYLNVDATYVVLGTTNNSWNGAHAAVTLKYLKTTD